MNGSIQPPQSGWLEVAERISAAQWPLTTFLLVLVGLAFYIGFLVIKHHFTKHTKDCDDAIKRHAEAYAQSIKTLTDGYEETTARATSLHKLCEWRNQRTVQAMMIHVKANNSGKRSAQGRRSTDNLVAAMLEAALKGPQTDAERAEVNAMQV